MRSGHQAQAGHTPWRSGACLADMVPRPAPHFSDRTACVCPCSLSPAPMRAAAARRKTRNQFRQRARHAPGASAWSLDSASADTPSVTRVHASLRVPSVWRGVGPSASCPDLGTKCLPRTARWRRIPRIPDCLSRPGTPSAPHRTALTTDTTARRPAATHADNRCCRPWACTSVVRAGPHGCAPTS